MRRLTLAAAAILLLSGVASAPPAGQTVDDAWYVTRCDGEPLGYGHQVLVERPGGGGFELRVRERGRLVRDDPTTAFEYGALWRLDGHGHVRSLSMTYQQASLTLSIELEREAERVRFRIVEDGRETSSQSRVRADEPLWESALALHLLREQQLEVGERFGFTSPNNRKRDLVRGTARVVSRWVREDGQTVVRLELERDDTPDRSRAEVTDDGRVLRFWWHYRGHVFEAERTSREEALRALLEPPGE